MAQKTFEIIRESDGVVLLQVSCDTDCAGATIHLFDQWQDPVHLNRYANTLLEASIWLNEQGVT